jgi:hypothetical protein
VHPDLVLFRRSEEPLSHTLHRLARLGFDTAPGNIVVHDAGSTD